MGLRLGPKSAWSGRRALGGPLRPAPAALRRSGPPGPAPPAAIVPAGAVRGAAVVGPGSGRAGWLADVLDGSGVVGGAGVRGGPAVALADGGADRHGTGAGAESGGDTDGYGEVGTAVVVIDGSGGGSIVRIGACFTGACDLE